MKVTAKPSDRAAPEHHAFDAQIKDAALLHHEFASRGKENGGRYVDDRNEGQNDLIEGHARLAAGLAALPQSTRMRRRTSTSLARMKNSIIAWKMPAVALGTCTVVCATWPPT